MASRTKYEVSKTGKVCETLNAAVGAAQRYCERLTDVGTCYVFEVGAKKASARIERKPDRSVVTYVNGRV